MAQAMEDEQLTLPVPAHEPGKTAQLTVYGRNLPGGKPDPAVVVDGKILEKIEGLRLDTGGRR